MSNNLSIGNLEILLQTSPSHLRILWRGEADERNPAEVIRPFLDQGASSAVEQNRKIVIDLSALDFMNSSCIGLITNFIKWE